MKTLLKKTVSFMKDEEGQGMVEYGLIIALVAIGLIVAIGLLKDNLIAIFNKVGATLGTAAG
jgi:pilus assembly protein Flp/PilA